MIELDIFISLSDKIINVNLNTYQICNSDTLFIQGNWNLNNFYILWNIDQQNLSIFFFNIKFFFVIFSFDNQNIIVDNLNIKMFSLEFVPSKLDFDFKLIHGFLTSHPSHKPF